MKCLLIFLSILLLINVMDCADCPSCEEANEVYSKTLAGCQNNCATKGRVYKCVPKAGCICKDGFIRKTSINRTCIPIEECPECPENEIYSCGNPFCEENCLELGKPCTVNIFRCEEKCYCQDGYVRKTNDGACVPRDSC